METIDAEIKMWRVCEYCTREIHCNARGMAQHQDEKGCKSLAKSTVEPVKRKFKMRECPAPRCGNVIDRIDNVFTCACGWRLEIHEGKKLKVVNL